MAHTKMGTSRVGLQSKGEMLASMRKPFRTEASSCYSNQSSQRNNVWAWPSPLSQSAAKSVLFNVVFDDFRASCVMALYSENIQFWIILKILHKAKSTQYTQGHQVLHKTWRSDRVYMETHTFNQLERGNFHESQSCFLFWCLLFHLERWSDTENKYATFKKIDFEIFLMTYTYIPTNIFQLTFSI